MKKFGEFLSAVMVSITIGLAISYATILLPVIVDLSFLEAVAVYHFWIHFGTWLNNYNQTNEE